MRAAGRLFVPLATLVVVAGAGLVHATFIGHYPFVGWVRLAWYLTYVLLLVVSAEVLGIPNIPPPQRPVLLDRGHGTGRRRDVGYPTPRGHTGTPPVRGVHLGHRRSDLHLLSASSPRRSWPGRQDATRAIVIVDGSDEIDRLRREIDRVPERPSMVVAGYTTKEMSAHRGTDLLVERCRSLAATVLVLDRVAQEDRWIIAQAGDLHSQGIRIRTLSMFYDQWLGKLPVNELERISLLFDINGLHRSATCGSSVSSTSSPP